MADAKAMERERVIDPELAGMLQHLKVQKPCKHVFDGWREMEDGLGGEAVCQKCGMGAMAYTLSLGI